MNDAIVNSINKYVMENDILYHLGDWSFGGINNIWEFKKRINCKNIHLILGNHDEHIKKNKILPNCNKGEILNFLYPLDCYETNYEIGSDVKAQDLFISVQKYLEIEIDKKIIVLSHFAFEEWYEMDHKTSYHFHGHNHHRFDYKELNTIYRRQDVGIDNPEFRPYSWDELHATMKTRLIKKHNL